jgi:hypothetical protein
MPPSVRRAATAPAADGQVVIRRKLKRQYVSDRYRFQFVRLNGNVLAFALFISPYDVFFSTPPPCFRIRR